MINSRNLIYTNILDLTVDNFSFKVRFVFSHKKCLTIVRTFV